MNGIEAIERIARECFRSLAALPNARLIDDGRVFGVQTPLPINFFSGIAMSYLSEEEVPRVLDEFRPRPFRWWISPSTRPSNLGFVLVEHGLHHTYDATGMMIDLRTSPGAPQIDGFTVRRVTDLHDWDRVFMEGFRRPESDRGLWKSGYEHLHDRWTHFVGYLDGAPVATTSLLDCGELAGIYHVVTLPQARGRGIGTAMTVAALEHAQVTGATHAALQASKMGFSVYRAIGFVPYCDLTLYDWRSSSVTA